MKLHIQEKQYTRKYDKAPNWYSHLTPKPRREKMTEQQQLIESPRIACALGSRPHCEISAIMLHCTFTSNFQYNWSATQSQYSSDCVSSNYWYWTPDFLGHPVENLHKTTCLQDWSYPQVHISLNNLQVTFRQHSIELKVDPVDLFSLFAIDLQNWWRVQHSLDCPSPENIICGLTL